MAYVPQGVFAMGNDRGSPDEVGHRRERLVGMVDQDIAFAQPGEDIGVTWVECGIRPQVDLTPDRPSRRKERLGRVRRILEIRPVETHELHQVFEPDRRGHDVQIALRGPQVLDQPIPDFGGNGPVDHQPDHRPELALRE